MTGNSDERFGADVLAEMLHRRLQTATSSYEQIINRLWAANGAGALAALAGIGSNKAHSVFIFVALFGFVLGLVLLAVMALCSLVAQTRVIRDLEDATSILDRRVAYAQRSSEEIGLSIYDFRTVMGFLSALMFLVGAVLGLLAAARVAGLSI